MSTTELREQLAPLSVWGRNLIDEKSFQQIENVARLPVTMRVALMPDAHVGYGLPIGGVAALEGAIAPYMVGVDIGCRMHATIFGRSAHHLRQKPDTYKRLLLEQTWFGRSEPEPDNRVHHSILDDARWDALPAELGDLRSKAVRQLGTSGSGNHFVEWAALTVEKDNPFGLKSGSYIALVSHSGSRAVGYQIANYYSKMAENLCPFLPSDLRKLAWLDHDSGPGAAYEQAMNLAGDFARANHEVIHQRIRAAAGMEVVGELQNHHNFAWRIDRDEQSPVFVHRKGATPAAAGVLGIIPSSMATPGFFVEGRCADAADILTHPSLNSAAHGSGRRLGRTAAKKKLDSKRVKQFLRQQGVTLLGGGLDEAPDAYKNPKDVIAAHSDLVRVWARFDPVIVRMAGDGGRSIGETGPRRDKVNHRRKKRR